MSTLKLNHFLQHALQENGYTFSSAIQNQLIAYIELLSQWNRVFNLTAIRDPEEMVILHLLDSLAIHPYLQGNRIIDVGTGAGLPGIPLALIHPDKHFTLLDSNNKKIRFLTQVKQELHMQNIDVIHTRCEDFHPDRGFDSIVSRAFASINVMLASTQHLIDKQGQFLAMKGLYPTEELAELPDTVELIAVYPLTIKGLNAERCLVCLAKRG